MSKRSSLPSRGPPSKQRQLIGQAECSMPTSASSGTWLDESQEEKKAVPPIPIAEAKYTKKCKLLPVPLLHEYKGGDFYFERDCYKEYFGLVDHQIVNEKQKCVTVTGTPGIGKSIFYVYFFDRFRKAHPGEWIIVAATYHKNFELSQFAIFEDETDVPTVHYAYASKQFLTSEINSAVKREAERASAEMRKPKQMLFLCDGPPPLIWPQTIVFTSPNEDWMSLSEIDSRDFYMPLWTVEELQEAALVLNFDIDDATIVQRCEIFGGVARQCFYQHTELTKALGKMITAIEAITSPEKLQDLLQTKENSRTRHRLLHYMPCDDRMRQTSRLASSFVQEKLTRQLLALLHREKESLRSMLRGFSEASSLRGWIFEVDSHEILRQGCTIHIKSLLAGGSPVTKSVQIVESEEIDEFDSETLSQSVGNRGPYHKPKAKILELVDSFYLRSAGKRDQEDASLDAQLILFQMTVSESHPVNASGIIHVLKKLDFLHKLDDVALVFVVPKELLEKFRRQKIVPVNTPTGSESIKEIKGIGIGTASVLPKYKVSSIDQLEKKIKAYEDKKIGMMDPKDKRAWDNAVKSWNDRGQSIQYAMHNNTVADISQYVCSLD